VTIRYSRETEPLGTAGPLTLVPDLSDTFLVMNGDLLTTLDYGDMIGYHRKNAAAVTVGLYPKQVKIDLGVIERTPGYRITGYVEKPTMSYDVSMGVYVMEPSVLRRIPAGVRFDLPDLVKSLVAMEEKVVGYPFEGLWLDIGRQDDYTQAADLFERNRHLFLPEADF
jgi:NDP-sugar pyrophosphorylase family protein